MNRFLLSIFCFILFTTTNYAQYTTIINANRPGDTETPYAVGRGVFQVENSLFYKHLNDQNIEYGDDKTGYKANAFSNNLNLQIGFLSERLQANLNHVYSNTNNDVSGTESLSLGLKYLIYDHVNKESPELKRSWKRRYGFKYNGLIPSVALSLKYNTSLANKNFPNKEGGNFSLAVITQNDISRKVRINNQFDYLYAGEKFAEFIYSISTSYVVAKRFNPYIQFRYHHLSYYGFYNIGIGTPFLVNKDFALAIHYNATFGSKIAGNEFGINAAFRIDRHHDRWKPINKKEEPKIEQKEEVIEYEDDNYIETSPQETAKPTKSTLKTYKPKKEKHTKKKKSKKKKKEPIEDVILSY